MIFHRSVTISETILTLQAGHHWWCGHTGLVPVVNKGDMFKLIADAQSHRMSRREGKGRGGRAVNKTALESAALV